MANVTLSHIHKQYGNVKVVEDFNLEIQDREFLVLVGPSGCGKSTTLRMIAGLEEISSGDLYIDQQRVNDIAPKDRDIAMVFQNYALYPHMNIYENMAFSLKLRKFPKEEIKQRVLEAANILDLEKYLNRKPKELSGGQRQRVALGRAIVREPKVFLMDEPLSNLDAKLRVQMRTEISKLHQRLEATIIYVTHDQTEALTMGDRIVVMKDGMIQQVATPTEIYQHPVNRFVAGFIGSPEMNFLTGFIQQDGEDCYFTNHDHKIRIPKGKFSFLKKYINADSPVILGIRPEAIHDEPLFIESTPDSTFAARIEVVENMGSELYLYVSGFGEKWLTARVSSRSNYKPDTHIRLAIDMNKVHFFDESSELCLV